MRIRPFEYHRPADMGQALTLLDQLEPKVKVLAGGTDLVLALKEKRAAPQHVLDIAGLAELNYRDQQDGLVKIGALATHASLAADPDLQSAAPALTQAVALIGSEQIRNVATIGGNLCNASPAADSAAPLLAYDAQAVLVDQGGESRLPLASFFRGPGETALKPGQLLKGIELAVPTGKSAGCYLKLMRRRAVDLSLAGVAVVASLDQDSKRLAEVAIALGGVAPTPLRVPEAEELLIGCTSGEARDRIGQAVAKAKAAARPISDVRATAQYRLQVVEAFTRRGLERALAALFA